MDNKKIIKTLEKQLLEFMTINQTSDMDFSTEIDALKNKIEQLSQPVEKKEVPVAWQKVQAARDKNRLSTLDYINGLLENFVELHGDRLYADDAAIVGGIGFLKGMPVTVIGHQKARILTIILKEILVCPILKAIERPCA